MPKYVLLDELLKHKRRMHSSDWSGEFQDDAVLIEDVLKAPTIELPEGQNNIVSYNAPRPVNVGDVFYCIEQVDHQTFREPCAVCRGERKLTVNGVTFDCPCCGEYPEVLKICKYVVRMYRVYEVLQIVPHSDGKPLDTYRVSFKLNNKSGQNYDDRYMSMENFCSHFNTPVEEFSTYFYDNYIYDNYNFAVSVANALTAQEVKKLEEYNASHGSAYAPVFKTRHDKRPKEN